LGWVAAWFFIFKKNRHKLSFIIALLLLLAFTWGIIQLTPVQNFLVKKVAVVLSGNLQTKVSIKHVNFSLFNKMLVQGVLVEDRKKDTLLYAGTAKVNITDWFFVKDKATLQYLGLNNAVINLKRTDSVWNYQFLVDYFSSPKKNTSQKKGLEIDFKLVELEHIRFNQVDKWIGHDMTVALNQLSVDADVIDFNKKNISINTINLDKPIFLLSDYTGNRPQQPKKIAAPLIPTPYQWNNQGWAINVKNILLKNGSFKSEKQTERLPYTDKFDGQHILFAAINGNLKNVQFIKDTLFVDVNLATREKCGFEV
jgi:hypothetical protein